MTHELELDEQLDAIEQREVLVPAFLEGLTPARQLTVAEWADQNRILSSKTSPEPGPYRSSRTPYAVEIMEALSPSHPCTEVVLMGGAQVGKSEIGNNLLLYSIARDPCPMLLVLPTDKFSKRLSRAKIDPILESTPSVASLISTRVSRGAANQAQFKDFPGGFLMLAGARTPVDLRSFPVRIVFMDELDGWELDASDEGDPSVLAERGTRTYGRRRKIYKCSTPKNAAGSRIGPAFERSDRSRYHVPCPECGDLEPMSWPRIKYPEGATPENPPEPEEVFLLCQACGALIPEWKKTTMLAEGTWIAEHPERSRRVRGFHLPSLLSPIGWRSWADVVASFLKATKPKNPAALRVWVNQDLAEVWEDRGETPDWEDLYRRREEYSLGEVPAGAVVLTAGVDVQRDRLELEIVGWGPGRESWSIDYQVLAGDPMKAEVWKDLEEVLDRNYRHASGLEARIRMTAIDASYQANEVYFRIRELHRPRSVMAVKGRAELPMTIGHPRALDIRRDGKRIPRGIKLWPVGVSTIKEQLYAWLRQKPPLEKGAPFPPGWCHFPQHPEEYFKMLTSEHLVPERNPRTGLRRWAWKLPEGSRNEALDCRVYARAAFAAVGGDRWTEADWERRAGELLPPGQKKRKKAARKTRPKADEGYLDRWVR